MLRFLVVLVMFLSFQLHAQDGTDAQLAQHYYSSGEFEKALPYCQKVFTKDPNKYNFKRYFDCLIQTGEQKDAERILKKQLNANQTDLEYPILLAEFYETNNDGKAATKIYQELIDEYAVSSFTITELYAQFKSKAKYDLAMQTLEKGRKVLKDNYPLHLYFADLYAIQGNNEKMIDEYLNLIEIQSSYANQVETALAQRIDFTQEESKEYELIKTRLIEKTQKKPNDFIYPELLIWLFTQKKQFNLALIQAQGLDKREGGFGKRVFELGTMCVQNKVYDVARKAFKYTVELGPDKPFFYEAEFALLNTRFLEITTQRNYDESELKIAVSEYENTLNRVGKSRSSVQLIREKAYIQAYYLDESQAAMSSLDDALKIPGLTDIQAAELKLLLADINVIRGDVWEASLLYMQVDKDFKFEPIGFEAKFKNARIFYFDGDFDFAQSQLDILKQSTTKLIANDAMKLSILITDNYGLDSNYVAMNQFAQADLLLEQRKYTQAFEKYDSIIKQFPYHSLSDEILLRKSKAMQEQGKWDLAITYLDSLMKYHAEDILADDALFQLGVIYSDHLLESEKGSEFFKRILMDYPGSLYTIACRTRLRILRGDKVELDEEL